MGLPVLLAALSAFLLASSVTAVPFELPSSSPQLNPRATAAPICSSDRRAADPSCWTTLKIADYLTTWSKTTPSCSENNGDGSDCCEAAEPFSTCFLRLASGAAGYQCDRLNSNFCSDAATTISSKLSPAIQAQARYVSLAIYQIHLFFSSYSAGQNYLPLQSILVALGFDLSS